MTVTLNGTNGVTFNDGSAQSTAATGFGFKNRFINGAMVIDQRNAGAAQTITVAGGNTYTVDRWFAITAGASITGQRVAGSGNNQYNYRFTGAAGVTSITFVQRIEAANCYDLAGQTVTLSLNLANSLLTSVSWNLQYAGTTDSWGGTNTQIASGSFTVSSTLTSFSAQISVPAAATTGLQLVLSVGAQTSGTWTIGNVQLEKGSTATSFDYRPYGTELMLCQRYYYRVTNYMVGYTFNNTVVATPLVTPKVSMRVSPTLDASGNTYTMGSGSVGTVALLGTSTAEAIAVYNSATNWNTGVACQISAGFGAEL